jgi:OPT family oligopeptide transporter
MGIRPRPLDMYVLPHLPRSVLSSRAYHPPCVSAFVYTVPVGVIQAITNQQVGLNVITELIIGYALPGRPIAMMLFKTWGYITMTQALQFTSDFKLGHYMKIPHRPMFFCQVAATIVAGTVQLGVQEWMFSNIEDLCSADQKDGFICPSTTVFGTASIIVSFVVLLHTFLTSVLNICCLCRSGESLGHSVCSRMVSSTTAFSSSSWPAPLHH